MMIFSKHNHRVTAKSRGFTLIEIMISLAVIAILATIALPSTLNQLQRRHVSEAVKIAPSIIQSVNYYYLSHLSFPADNKEADLPEANLLIGNNVTKIEVEDGAIHITLGNKISKSLQDKVLTIRPAIVTGSPSSPISWICGYDKPVSGMQAVGENRTDLPIAVIPSSCGY